MRNIIAHVLCLCIFYLVYHVHGVRGTDERDTIEPTIYKKLVGEWEGSLKTKEPCSKDNSCSYQLIFNSDYTFFMQVGVACLIKTASTCKIKGNVIGVTEDTVTVNYTCPGGCFCEATDTSLEFCYRYTKPTVMSLNIAMYFSPPELYDTCPARAEVSCVVNNNRTESVAMGVIECMRGECLVCSSADCSNRGVCNAIGTCDCFYSFSGPTCNVSACTNSCSGHGICDMTITKLLMGMSIYDKSKRVGVCRCFSGWTGHSCSSPDIFAGRQKLWEGLIFIAIVSIVTASTIVLRKFIHLPFRQRTRRTRHHRRFMTFPIPFRRR